ncbi:MAG TPA: NAD-dependent epimerase/dehydratase family protein [Leifsonia sp.]
MRVAVIGATGHVGTYLVPRLVAAGHDVVAVSRGTQQPYRPDAAWDRVERLHLDREVEERAGTFGHAIAELAADVVVDMICFTPESARQLVDTLRGRTTRLIMCTTIWVKGTLAEVPALEDARSEPWGAYGTGKAAIEALLADEASAPGGLRSTCIRPGHICGPGWPITNPLGNLDLQVWETLAAGEELVMPHLGLETLNHVHASDVAAAFLLAVERQSGPPADRFSVVAERALTMRGFAEAVAGWFGQDAHLRFVPWDEYAAQTTEDAASTTYNHLARSHSMSIEHARAELGYEPEYTSLAAVAESLEWLRQDGRVSLGGKPVPPE